MNLGIIALDRMKVRKVNIFSKYIKLAKLASKRFLRESKKCPKVRKVPLVGFDQGTSILAVKYSKFITLTKISCI